MKAGIYLTNQHPLGTDQVRALEEQLILLRAARDLGFSSVFAGQHYLSDSLTHIQPLPYLARLAAESGDMHLGVGIILLSLVNPVEVAENYASLDVITGGRLILGVGLGYRQVEFDAFGVDSDRKVSRFTANLDVVKRLWSGEPVSVDLPWCRLDEVKLNLLPVQRPSPPIWMAANSDASVRRAAVKADAWMVNPHANLATIQRQRELYRQTRAAAGLDPVDLPVMREVFCAKDRASALELAAPYLGEKYRVYSRWGQDKVMPEAESFDIPYEKLSEQRFIVGSPEDCISALTRWRDEIGTDYFILRTRWPGMPLASAVESMKLLAAEVIPAVAAVPPPALSSVDARNDVGA
jgi:alkanesulfonate monooxygenase SsuD/methylene tetrahydromethanopterin reductase-like flavin-dependent oxidoreductase (luciferase family)